MDTIQLLRRLAQINQPPTSYAPYGEEYAEDWRARMPSPVAQSPVASQRAPLLKPNPVPEGYKPGAAAQVMRGEFPMAPGRGVVGSVLQHLMPTGEVPSTAPIDLEGQRGMALPAETSISPDLEGQRGGVRRNALPPALQALIGAPPAPPPKPTPPNPMLGGSMPSLSAMENGMPPNSPPVIPQSPDLEGQRGIAMTQGSPAANGGNGADQGALAGLMQRFPNLPQSLLTMGLATMAAGGKPGATFGGAIGEGGLAAMQLHEQRRRNDNLDKREERQLAQGDRRLDLEQKGLDLKGKDFLLQLEQRAKDNQLNREARAEAQRDLLEFRKLSLEAQQGNQASQRALTAMIESGRREDRHAEGQRRSEQDQRRVDEDAAKHFRERLEALTEKGSVPETPEMRRKVEGEILDIFGPKTRVGRTALYRQLGEAIDQIKASPLSPEEKERRIGEAKKRVDEAMK